MSAFDKIPEEKQLAVLNAAFSCFGKNGYKKTSMADIAASAKISKASLFQYFGTKKNLYLRLYRFAIEKISDEMVPGSDDFFACIEIAAKIKMKVMERYPGMFDYLTSSANERDSQISADLQAINSDSVSIELGKFYRHVDWNKLKPNIDRQIVFNALTWINEGYLRTKPEGKSPEELVEGLSRYLELIKSAVYREEYL